MCALIHWNRSWNICAEHYSFTFSLLPSCCLALSNKGATHCAEHLNLRALLPEELQSHQIQCWQMLLSTFHIKILKEKEPYMKKTEFCLLFLVPSLCVCSLRYQHYFFFFYLCCFWLCNLEFVLIYWVIIINCGQLLIDCRGWAGSIRELIFSWRVTDVNTSHPTEDQAALLVCLFFH